MKHDKFPETGERKKFNKKIILKSLSQIQRKRKKKSKIQFSFNEKLFVRNLERKLAEGNGMLRQAFGTWKESGNL